VVGRALDIDGFANPDLDARAIVLGVCIDSAPSTPTPAQTPTSPAVVWEGNVVSDGTGPQRSYFVRLCDNRTAHCQCPAFYFRGVLRRDPTFVCKHLLRARAATEDQP
jgi:hypothetical protein